jgi:hypothetical protein
MRDMAESEDNLEYFLELMSEENYGGESPEDFLMDLWKRDRDAFCVVIRGSLKHMKNFRGMDDCILHICLTIGPETRELVEEIALKPGGRSGMYKDFLSGAILLGSTKALDKFKKGFENSFARGIGPSQFDRADVLGRLETILFLRLSCMLGSVARLAALKDEQSHRTWKPFWGLTAKLMPGRRKRWHNFIDREAIKLAEATIVYFTKGAAGLKEYLDTKGDSEYRAREYIFCLACDRNPQDLGYLKQQYARYRDHVTKRVCIEAILYVSDSALAAEFIDEQLGQYNLARLIKKRDYDLGVTTIWAHDLRFYCLLDACYYLKALNEGLVCKLKILAEARETRTSTPAMLTLQKFDAAAFDKKRIDPTKEFLLKMQPMVGGIVSMARSVGRL